MGRREAEQLKKEGNTAYGAKNYERAKECYVKAIRKDQNYAQPWFNLGQVFRRLNNPTAAQSCFMRALQISPFYERASEELVTMTDGVVRRAGCFFMIVDLKLTADGEVKVLELGKGLGAETKGLQVLHRRDHVSLFRQARPRCTYNKDRTLFYPEKAQELTRQQELQPDSRALVYDSVSSYRSSFNAYLSQPTSPDLLRVDDSATFHCLVRDKALLDEWFKLKGLAQYRPRSVLVNKTFTLDEPASGYEEAQRIMQNWGELVVFKEVDLSHGEGLEIFPCARVATGAKPRSFLFEEGTSYASVRLVEEYVPSKEVIFGEATYDATMRVILLAQCEPANQPRVELLDAYWKLPPKPTERGHFEDQRACRISSFKDEARACAVAPDDQNIVRIALEEIFIRGGMLEDFYRRPEHVFSALLDRAQERVSQQICLQLRLADAYKETGMVCKALAYSTYRFWPSKYKVPRMSRSAIDENVLRKNEKRLRPSYIFHLDYRSCLAQNTLSL